MPQMKGRAALDLWFWGDEFQQDNGVPVSLPLKIYNIYISCQQELLPCVQQNYGIFPKWFRKLLLVFEIVLGSIQRV